MTAVLLIIMSALCVYLAVTHLETASRMAELRAENTELRWKIANHNHPALRRAPWEN